MLLFRLLIFRMFDVSSAIFKPTPVGIFGVSFLLGEQNQLQFSKTAIKCTIFYNKMMGTGLVMNFSSK